MASLSWPTVQAPLAMAGAATAVKYHTPRENTSRYRHDIISPRTDQLAKALDEQALVVQTSDRPEGLQRGAPC